MTSASTISFRSFLERGLLRGDHGQEIAMTPLLKRFLEAVEGGAKVIVICTPRRCGKSTLISTLIAHYLLTRRLSFTLAVAATVDQASDILSQKLSAPLRHMRLAQQLGLRFARGRLQASRIDSTAVVLPASDVSSPGRTADLLILDECRGIPEAAVEVLRPSASGGLIVLTGTPGAPRGWWHAAVKSPEAGAAVIEISDPEEAGNPELDLAFVRRERERLAKRGAYGQLMSRREWSAEWVDLTDTPLIDPGLVEAASVEDVEPYDPEQDEVHVGVDLAVSRDLCSAAVLARRGDDLRVIELLVLDPKTFGGQIPLPFVEERLEVIWSRYRPRRMVMDQFQGISIAQRLQARGVRIEAIAITGSTNMESFGSLHEVLNAARLRWPRALPGTDRLTAELLNLSVEESAAGFRVVDASRRFHRDVSFSLALAVRSALTTPRSACGEARLIRDVPWTPRAGVEPTAEDDQRRAELAQVKRRNRRRIHELVWGGVNSGAHPHEND